jgi:hypothetical protein
VAALRALPSWPPVRRRRLPGFGRVGLSICYESWFPELARHLAWRGAEVILNPTLTPTADRPQELVLARAQAIVNQVYVVGVHGAAPACCPPLKMTMTASFTVTM